jgi:hypothetical protein
MTFDVRALAAQKHLETGHAELEWLKAFETARQSLKFLDIDHEGLNHLALASRAPARFTVMMRLIYQYGKSHPHGDQITDRILEMTSESPYSLSDWIDAIDYFQGWLTKNGRKIDFLPMLKYLACCVDSPDAKEGGQTFAALVEDMLTVVGYEG